MFQLSHLVLGTRLLEEVRFDIITDFIYRISKVLTQMVMTNQESLQLLVTI